MFEIKKVFFNSTVHWYGLGPISELDETQFRDAMWVENMPGFAFEHASGEITWVPASNIRWVQAIIREGEDHVEVEPSRENYEIDEKHDPDLPIEDEVIKRKPGRPRKVH